MRVRMRMRSRAGEVDLALRGRMLAFWQPSEDGEPPILHVTLPGRLWLRVAPDPEELRSLLDGLPRRPRRNARRGA